MQQNYYFNGARNDKVINPHLDFFKDFFDNVDSSYWNDQISSGDAAIFFENEEDKMLIFFYEEKYGFFFFNLDYDIPIQFSDEMKDDIVITHRIGGEPMHVPTIGFKTKEEALKIIQYFIIHKEKIPDFKWVNLHEIDFPENKIVNLF